MVSSRKLMFQVESGRSAWKLEKWKLECMDEFGWIVTQSEVPPPWYPLYIRYIALVRDAQAMVEWCRSSRIATCPISWWSRLESTVKYSILDD